MPDLKAYFSIGGCHSGSWLNGDTIVFSAKSPEGFSLRTLSLSTGEEKALFTSTESLRPAYVPRGSSDVFFTCDVGGTENIQIYRIRGGGQPEDLTRDPETVHNIGGLLPDGKTMVISCNARKKGTFDIMLLDTETGEKRMLLQNSDNYNMPAGLSPDGRYFLYNKLVGSSNNALWMVDTQSGEARKTPGNEATASRTNAEWTSDSAGFYFVSDEDDNYSHVSHFCLKTGKETVVLPFDKEIERISLSTDDRFLAVSLNDNGYSALHIYDLEAKCFVTVPRPPMGLHPGYFAMHWAPDSHRLLLTAWGATRTENLWLLDVDNDSLRRVTTGHMAGLTQADFCEPTLHTFKSFDGLEVPYFLYTPKGMHKKMPVMVSIHGGPEGQSRPGASGKELIHYMVSQGIAVVEPNIRGSTGYGKIYTHLDDVEKRLDSIKDIEWLVGHLTSSGIADAKKIAVMGGSYGGFMTLSCAARMPKLWCCAVCTVGMFNLVTFLENTADYRRPHRESEYGTLANHRDILFNVSPVAKVDDIIGPLMIIHGQNDPRVPVSEAHQTVEYLEKRGVNVDMHIYPDEGHGLAKLKNKLDCYPKVMDFVKKHMEL